MMNFFRIARIISIFAVSIFVFSCSTQSDSIEKTGSSMLSTPVFTPSQKAFVSKEASPTETAISITITRTPPEKVFYNLHGELLYSSTKNIYWTDLLTSENKILIGGEDEIIVDYPIPTMDGSVYYLSDKNSQRGIMEVYRIKSKRINSE